MFSFSPEFYKTALNVLIKNEIFTEHIDKINEDFFSEDADAIEHFRNIKSMVKKYGYINEKIYKEEHGKKAEKLLSFNYKTMEEYVKSNMRKFIYVSGVKSFMDETTNILKEDFRNISEDEIDKLVFGLERNRIKEQKQIPLFYFKDISRRILETSVVKGIPTGWHNIDNKLLGNGLCPGDLGLIVGLSNKGKSITLVNLSAMAATFGKKVLYVSLEMEKKKIGRRIDMRLTGFTYDEIDANVFEVERRLNKFKKITKGDIIIQEFNSSAASVSDIREAVLQLRRSGHDIDFLVVDYADILIPRKKYNREDLGYKEIFEDLRKIGNEFNMPVWTVSQSNRSGCDSKVLGMKEIADAFSKIYVVDLMITINQDDEQKRENKMAFHVAKDRNGMAAGHIEILSVDFSRMIITDADDYEIFYGRK